MYSGTLDVELRGAGAGWIVHPRKSDDAENDTVYQRWARAKPKDEERYAQEAADIKEYTGWNSWEVHPCSHLFNRAATFKPITEEDLNRWDKGKDSTIQYTIGSETMTGRIRQILRTEKIDRPVAAGSETKVLVQRYKELSEADQKHDPFRQVGFAAGRLVYEEYHAKFDVIEPNSIISHVARCRYRRPGGPIETPCLAIISLNRVSRTSPFTHPSS